MAFIEIHDSLHEIAIILKIPGFRSVKETSQELVPLSLQVLKLKCISHRLLGEILVRKIRGGCEFRNKWPLQLQYRTKHRP